MNTDRFTRPKPILSMAALAGWLVISMAFSGTALAASAPTVKKIDFTDTKGTADTSDDVAIQIATGYSPFGVAADDKGNVYVTDPVMNTVSVFNTNGRLAKPFSINRALAVGVDSSRGLIYASGSLNNMLSIFVLDNNYDGVNDNGNLGGGWGQPADIAVDTAGNVYAADMRLHMVKKFTPQGAIIDYGPYGGEKYASEFSLSRTRHRMMFPKGIAVDEVNGLFYVSIKEFVEYLSNSGGTDSDQNQNRYIDTEESWKYYNNVLGVATDSTYKYWWPVTDTTATKYWVIAVDITTGNIVKKIQVGDGSDYTLTSFQPKGLALDGKGRLYVAAVGGTAAAGGEIKVYDVSTGLALSVNGGFDAGIYTDLAFSPDTNPDPDPSKAKGRLFVASSSIVSVYSIDGGANPGNTAPSAPFLVSPSKNSYATSATPTLVLANATDNERDPLRYGYEIMDKNGSIVASAFGFTEGLNGRTNMTVTSPLAENTLYSWRAQSFDGGLSAWTDDKVDFCVNSINDDPDAPVVVSPLNISPVSPFSSSLIWSQSNDPDCYDKVTYTVDLSSDPLFSAVHSSMSLISGLSLNLGDLASNLAAGGTYYWRVKAVDNNEGESSYSTGSFVYKTTAVRFESDQPDTKVYVDGNYAYSGRYLGTAGPASPLDIQTLYPGSHFVTFIKAGYEPYHSMVNVKDPLVEDLAVTVSAVMAKASRIKPAASGTELLKGSGYAAPFVVDYNNDGLKDVVTGDADGNLYLYISEEQLQDGTQKVVLVAQGAIQNINVGSNSVPFVVDYDNDGKKDILVGAGNGLLYKYINGGSDQIPVFASAVTIKDNIGSSIQVANSAPSIVDYNNDGRKDLIVGGSDGRLRLYKNLARSERSELDDAAPEFDANYETISAIDANLTVAELNVGSNSKPFFTDWNSDGKKDLVVGRGDADSGGNTVNLFLNVGTDDAPSFVTVSGLQNWIKGKKRERGNREFIPYLGYNQDLGDLSGGEGDVVPFVVGWGGSPARDILVGNGAGSVSTSIAE